MSVSHGFLAIPANAQELYLFMMRHFRWKVIDHLLAVVACCVAWLRGLAVLPCATRFEWSPSARGIGLGFKSWTGVLQFEEYRL